MPIVIIALTFAVCLSLLIWIYLLGFHARGPKGFWQGTWQGFWMADQRLAQDPALAVWPKVIAIIPARDEADCIEHVIQSHLNSDYPGPFEIILCDDHSTDDTAKIARAAASRYLAQSESKNPHQLTIIKPPALEKGWTGKLWALHHGILHAKKIAPDYYLLTDADILHAKGTLRNLVAKAAHENHALVSLMARLDTRGLWGQTLVPAFIYFFMKLYPFARVNDPADKLAGAAGGCMLVNAKRLEETGGLENIRNALIDDCALANQIKNTPEMRARIFLGLADKEVISLRDNRSLTSIWNMVARTAYTQLEYSPTKLFLTLIGMIVVYLIAPIALITTPFHHSPFILLTALTIWGLMSFSFIPTLRHYGLSPFIALTLPFCGLLYTLMTFASAMRHWRGSGGQWKGRSYS